MYQIEFKLRRYIPCERRRYKLIPLALILKNKHYHFCMLMEWHCSVKLVYAVFGLKRTLCVCIAASVCKQRYIICNMNLHSKLFCFEIIFVREYPAGDFAQPNSAFNITQIINIVTK